MLKGSVKKANRTEKCCFLIKPKLKLTDFWVGQTTTALNTILIYNQFNKHAPQNLLHLNDCKLNIYDTSLDVRSEH